MDPTIDHERDSLPPPCNNTTPPSRVSRQLQRELGERRGKASRPSSVASVAEEGIDEGGPVGEAGMRGVDAGFGGGLDASQEGDGGVEGEVESEREGEGEGEDEGDSEGAGDDELSIGIGIDLDDAVSVTDSVLEAAVLASLPSERKKRKMEADQSRRRRNAPTTRTPLNSFADQMGRSGASTPLSNRAGRWNGQDTGGTPQDLGMALEKALEDDGDGSGGGGRSGAKEDEGKGAPQADPSAAEGRGSTAVKGGSGSAPTSTTAAAATAVAATPASNLVSPATGPRANGHGVQSSTPTQAQPAKADDAPPIREPYVARRPPNEARIARGVDIPRALNPAHPHHGRRHHGHGGHAGDHINPHVAHHPSSDPHPDSDPHWEQSHVAADESTAKEEGPMDAAAKVAALDASLPLAEPTDAAAKGPARTPTRPTQPKPSSARTGQGKSSHRKTSAAAAAAAAAAADAAADADADATKDSGGGVAPPATATTTTPIAAPTPTANASGAAPRPDSPEAQPPYVRVIHPHDFTTSLHKRQSKKAEDETRTAEEATRRAAAAAAAAAAAEEEQDEHIYKTTFWNKEKSRLDQVRDEGGGSVLPAATSPSLTAPSRPAPPRHVPPPGHITPPAPTPSTRGSSSCR